jgi:hypothetical protein
MVGKRPADASAGPSNQKAPKRKANFETLRDDDPEYFEMLQTDTTIDERLFDKDLKLRPTTAARRARTQELIQERFLQYDHPGLGRWV